MAKRLFWINSSRNRKGDRTVVAVHAVHAAMC
jgi:hypothetical protein